MSTKTSVRTETLDFDNVPSEPSWSISVPGFDLHLERELESLLAVGNGLIGTRGSLEEGIEESQPATLLAGVFDRLPKRYDPPEDLSQCPSLIVAPNWLKLSLLI